MADSIFNKLKINDAEQRLISTLVYEKFGIVLDDKKKTLIIGRLQKTLADKGFKSFKSYYDAVLKDESGKELLDLVDKLSTNYTYFFRELEHLNFLKTVVLPEFYPKIVNGAVQDMRIWSAAASYGAEVYSIKMIVDDFNEAKSVKIIPRYLATDISTSALNKAVKAVYDSEMVVRTPKNYFYRYFEKVDRTTWKLKDSFKKGILFKRLNLIDDRFPFRNKFSVVFCKNVMIYFDEQTKERLVRRIYDVLEPGGYFFVGLSESLGTKQRLFKYVKPSVYKKM